MNTGNCGNIWKSLVFATSRARILRFFAFLVKLLTFHPTTLPCVSSFLLYIVFISISHHLLNHLLSSSLYITLFPSLYSSLLYIYASPSLLSCLPSIVYLFSIHSYNAYHHSICLNVSQCILL